jgi:hypothetical protein
LFIPEVNYSNTERNRGVVARDFYSHPGDEDVNA